MHELDIIKRKHAGKLSQNEKIEARVILWLASAEMADGPNKELKPFVKDGRHCVYAPALTRGRVVSTTQQAVRWLQETVKAVKIRDTTHHTRGCYYVLPARFFGGEK